MTEDADLLVRFSGQRDESAFGELITRHVDLVYSTALRVLNGDAHLAEDVAQRVFIDLARKAPSLPSDVVIPGWLYEAARFTAANTVRGEQRRKVREQEALAMQHLTSEPNAPWEQVAPYLDEAMGQLKPSDRNAILLRYFQNLDFQSVGHALGVSDDTAQKRVSRAIERVRELLAKRGVSIGACGLVLVLSTNAVHAAPAGMAALISTTATLGGMSVPASAAVAATKAIAMTTLQKSLMAGAIALAVAGGVTTLLVTKSTNARAELAAAAGEVPADFVIGNVKAPDGKPLRNALVFLSTASVAVPIYTDPPPEVVSTVTGRDGRFTFPANPENRAVIVIADAGYGEATVADLASHPEIKLQPWARIKGTLRQGATPLADQTIRLSRTRFGSKIQEQAYRAVHDTMTRTDSSGHYSFPRIAPGDAWISWRTDQGGYELQYRYFDIQPGQTLMADIGGRGRAVTGRAVPSDVDTPVKFFGSVWPKTPHQMRRPPNWSELSPEEQELFTAQWEKTPAAKLYNQEKCPIDFRLAADGTFTIPDVPAGDYRITVASWSGAPVRSRMLSRGTAEFSIIDASKGTSDAPFDVGEIVAYSTSPLQVGDRAPLFETTTFDGGHWKLADQQGKFVLMHFWHSKVSESLDDLETLKAVQNTWGQNKHFALVGLNFDSSLSVAQQYATNNGLNWTQGYLGTTSEVPMKYRLRRPIVLLIGPDGLIVRPQLSGPEIQTALENALDGK